MIGYVMVLDNMLGCLFRHLSRAVTSPITIDYAGRDKTFPASCFQSHSYTAIHRQRNKGLVNVAQPFCGRTPPAPRLFAGYKNQTRRTALPPVPLDSGQVLERNYSRRTKKPISQENPALFSHTPRARYIPDHPTQGHCVAMSLVARSTIGVAP